MLNPYQVLFYYFQGFKARAQIWNYTTGWEVRSSPAVVDGRVYICSLARATSEEKREKD